MMMTLQQAAAILEAKLINPAVGGFDAVSTDTRKINYGDLFVALRGPNFDGHAFAEQAKNSGAAALLVDHPLDVQLPQLLVNDTRLALGRLAAAWRTRFHGPLIAVTGSNGKTTIKEMLASILQQRGNVLATEGNLNNDIGLPLTLLRLRPEHQFAVIEMGASHAGEIAYLTGLAQPDVALVANAAAAHLEGFGTIEDVARAKAEIWQGLKEDGIAIINADDDFANYWRELVADYRHQSFGVIPDADVHLGSGGVRWSLEDGSFKSRFDIDTPQGSVAVALELAGRHNVANALAATTAALAVGVSLADVQAGLGAMRPVNGRLQPKVAVNGQLLIDDTYNANPQSFSAAIDVLSQSQGETALVMGGMAELGDDADALHRQVGARALQRGVTYLFATGQHGQQAVRAFGERAVWFDTQQALIDSLQAFLSAPEHQDAVLLVKGSRSAKMENVVNALVNNASKSGAGHGGGLRQPQAACRAEGM